MISGSESTIAATPISRRHVAPPRPGGNYVMQGLTSEKALDIYHLIFAPTHACNLRCKHCYLPDHDVEALPKEIAMRLVDEWSEIVLEERGPFRGIFHVKGGEPFVVPYLGDIMDRLVELQSMRLMLTTNGTFTNEKTLNKLQACHDGLSGHVTVIVSLDGASAKTHDALRGDGQFEVTTSFIRAIRARGIFTHLNCVLHGQNMHEIPAYVRLAMDLGADQINFLPLVPKGYGSTVRCLQVPHLQLHQQLQAVYDSGDECTRRLLAGSLSHIADRNKRGILAACECVAAYQGLFYITPEGSVFTCPNLLNTEHSIGNVKNLSLRELCDRLPILHRKLRADGSNDRHLCTGERTLYESIGDKRNLANLREMQSALTVDSPDTSTNRVATAYCVSRNF